MIFRTHAKVFETFIRAINKDTFGSLSAHLSLNNSLDHFPTGFMYAEINAPILHKGIICKCRLYSKLMTIVNWIFNFFHSMVYLLRLAVKKRGEVWVFYLQVLRAAIRYNYFGLKWSEFEDISLRFRLKVFYDSIDHDFLLLPFFTTVMRETILSSVGDHLQTISWPLVKVIQWLIQELIKYYKLVWRAHYTIKS